MFMFSGNTKPCRKKCNQLIPQYGLELQGRTEPVPAIIDPSYCLPCTHVPALRWERHASLQKARASPVHLSLAELWFASTTRLRCWTKNDTERVFPRLSPNSFNSLERTERGSSGVPGLELGGERPGCWVLLQSPAGAVTPGSIAERGRARSCMCKSEQVRAGARACICTRRGPERCSLAGKQSPGGRGLVLCTLLSCPQAQRAVGAPGCGKETPAAGEGELSHECEWPRSPSDDAHGFIQHQM